MRLWLPAVAGSLEKAPLTAVAERLPASSRLVLVVDDERVVRDLAVRTLQQAGFQVLRAESGRKAVEIFRARRDDVGLVVLDLTMPDAGGLETFAELRRVEPRLPVLLSSGYTEEAVASVCQSDPLAAFLAKPYAPEDLLACVRDMLARDGA
jgi:CheY-like chemotaxis protein